MASTVSFINCNMGEIKPGGVIFSITYKSRQCMYNHCLSMIICSHKCAGVYKAL